MEVSTVEISVRGKLVSVPSTSISGREIIVTGKWLKVASVKDTEWLEGEIVERPETFIAALKQFPSKPDIFTFSQRLGSTELKYPYHVEWDNVAAIPITTYSEWWEKRLPQVSRKNVRRAQRRGVVAKLAAFDDNLVDGITRIYNETPIRQGRRFWHYGKDFATVKKDNSTYRDRSVFVGAYYQDELIGFIKIVYVDKVARIMQILSMNQHFDKRPANILIAKGVEACCQRGASHFIYGKYAYDNKTNSPLTEFKRRNGFEQMMIPTYYVPLTPKGRIALGLRLHLGVKRMIPESLMKVLLHSRTKLYEWRGISRESTATEEKSECGEKAAAD
jgi:GNAT acetyltransferase-like protein